MTQANDKSVLKVRTSRVNGPTDTSNLGFVRVATAVPKLKVGDTTYNAAETVALIPQAQAVDAKVLVFPELGMTGYTCADLFQNRTLRKAAVAALAVVKEATVNYAGIVFVGAPLEIDRKLFNCAVAISRGKILGIVPKTFLPNYNEFYEKRWFAQSPSLQSTHVEILGEVVPVGVDLLFTCEELGDLTIGVDVCEDAWAPLPPGLLASLNGATLIVNLSASNELVGKAQFRRGLVASLASSQLCGYAYTSAGVHESTTDVVFSGAMVIAECGVILKENARFERDSVLQYAEIDLERIVQDRLCNPTFTDCQTQFAGVRSFREVRFSVGSVKRPEKLVRAIDASPFVPKDKATLGARCLEIFSIQTAALAKRLDTMRGSSGRPPKVTIGVSGGLDSTLALVAAVRTYDMLGIPRHFIHGYTLPGFGTTSRTKGNAHSLMKTLGITPHEVDIRKACLAQMQEEGYKPFGIDLTGLDVDAFSAKLVEAQEAAVAGKTELKDLYFENVQARMRTKILMDNGFVIGTGDVSELAKGWCTYNGDHMSMYNVNCSVPKTLVKFLVEWAANTVFDGDARTTMLDIVATEISPELLPTGKDGKISQKTEDKVGPYELVDFFLYYVVRWGATPEKILYLAQHAKFSQDYTEAELLKWLKDFLVRFFANQFKRSCVPDGPKVGSISLSPRGDWRMPSDADPAIWLTWVDQAIAALPVSAPTNGGSNGAHANQGNPMSASKVSPATLAKLKLSQAQFDTIVARLDARQKAGGKRILRVHGRVDVMDTFMSYGSLPVAGGEEIVPGVNELSRSGDFDVQGDFQDAHPEDHGSFFTEHPGTSPYVSFVELNGVQQQMWTKHGIDDGRTTPDGNQFHKDLDRSQAHFTFKKGQDKRVDSYSGLYDNGRNAPADVKAKFPFLGKSTGFVEWVTELADAVNAEGIEFTADGLALTHCVKFTAVDARSQTYKGKQWEVQVVIDCTRPIVLPGETVQAVLAREKAEMEALGIKVVNKADVLAAAAAQAPVSAGK
ncbi:MAG: NAD(+) synthase [Cyanobacteria bacterium SZAS TMP-1]|nr:NAD(+) synthase [Cyanobacteria bacterium SZAS TMP-1]